MKDYHINIFWSDEDGGYIADIPDLEACSAFGTTPAEALAEVEQPELQGSEFPLLSTAPRRIRHRLVESRSPVATYDSREPERGRCSVSKTIEEVVEQLKRDPSHPVRATLGGLAVEVRPVPDLPGDRSAAELFAAVGPWAGETTGEILGILAKARAQGGQHTVADL
jgi:hypothetical protein